MFSDILKRFIANSDLIGTDDHQLSVKGNMKKLKDNCNCPKEFNGLSVKISLGKGNWADVTWIGFTSSGQTIQRGIYPVYLYYRKFHVLILAYGISDSNTPQLSWNKDAITIKNYFTKQQLGKPPRYGSSMVYKAYRSPEEINEIKDDEDLNNLIAEYKSVLLQNITKTEEGSNKPLKESSGLPEQIIYFGAPGTGKSYNIEKELNSKNIQDAQVKRVIFYPDYSYSDFIGGLTPVTNNEGQPEYRFVAGPFTEILKDAFNNPDKQYYMLIEEINRGNAAAIFGDVFQLLDRNSSGRSKYTITNSDICGYLRGHDISKFKNDRIWLPSNLNIICTMNTADQNVFVLDTAFKRRFTMEYVSIDFGKLDADEVKGYNDETKVFEGSKSFKDLFESTDLGSYVNEHETTLKRNWPTFAQLVNEKINIVNGNGDSISEDKKLGPFFVTLEELKDRRKFADKVLYYLKQDVFKYTDSVLIPSYQKLYDDFVKGKADIFELFAAAK